MVENLKTERLLSLILRIVLDQMLLIPVIQRWFQWARNTAYLRTFPKNIDAVVTTPSCPEKLAISVVTMSSQDCEHHVKRFKIEQHS